MSRFSTKYQFSEVKPSHTHFWEPPSFSSTITRVLSKSHTTPDTEWVTILYKKVSSVRSNPHDHTFENHRVCPRQLLVRVVNHTLLLIRSVSQFSTKRFVEWGQTLTDALLRTSKFLFFSAITRARSKSHTTPDTECVTILYKISVQWGKTLTHALLRTSELVSAVTFVRSKSYTTPNTECVTIFNKKYQFSEVKPSYTHFWEPASCFRQLLVRVVNHTLLLIRSVSWFSTKYQFSEVKPSQSHIWEPGSLFSAVSRVRGNSHTTPNTECGTILYKISVQWDKIPTVALLRTSEFVLGRYSCE